MQPFQFETGAANYTHLYEMLNGHHSVLYITLIFIAISLLSKLPQYVSRLLLHRPKTTPHDH